MRRKILKKKLEILTNPIRTDGFGGQFQNIIWAYIYCKMKNVKFLLTPMKEIEHNYKNDSLFAESLNSFINYKEFEICNSVQKILKIEHCYSYIEKNINSIKLYLEEIKNIFYKNKTNPLDSNFNNIVVHIRVKNSGDPDNSSMECRIKDIDYYIDALKNIENINSEKNRIIICSQGEELFFEKFKKEFKNIILFLNKPIQDTFLYLCYADSLITSKSSFSYTAAMLNNNKIYYTKFWHPPLENWIIIK